MAQNRKKRTDKRLSDEGTITSITQITSPAPKEILEYFRNLTEEDQDEILRMIISEGDIKRLIALAESMALPGNVELFLDRVQYHHFLPIAEIDPQGQAR